MKYIMMSDGVRTFPVIFPNDFVHKHMAGAVQGMLGGAVFLKPVSAGDWSPISGECSGESETLNLKSRGEVDSKIIASYDYYHGCY